MIKAVLDTNILASGVSGVRQLGSTPGEVIRRWRGGQFLMVVSEHILEELDSTLGKPYFAKVVPAEQRDRYLDLIQRYALITPLTSEIRGMATHPEDDPVLATAFSAGADYLVTGDRQLLALEHIDRTAIVRAREFVDILRASRQ